MNLTPFKVEFLLFFFLLCLTHSKPDLLPGVGTHLFQRDLGSWELRIRTNGFYQLLEDLGEVVEGADVENVLGVLLQQDPVELHGVSS